MLDFLILYEHRQRELNNALLLKSELKKRGFKVKVASLYNCEIPGVIQPFYYMKPKVILVPWLYSNLEVEKIKRIIGKSKFDIVDLQCEQVLSEKWIKSGYHFPKGDAVNAYHICWGRVPYNRLLKHGVPKENLLLTGSISLDFNQPLFKPLFYNKKEISEKYCISQNKDWILFISSFTFTNVKKEEMDELYERTKVDNIPFMKTMIKSKSICLEWLEKFAKSYPDKEIIYRPHPNEKFDKEINELSNKLSNFYVVSDYSVGQWIYVSDYINTWISTSIVDAVYMNKRCCVVRPVEVNHYDDSELFYDIDYISNYEDFERFNIGANIYEISTKELKKYYINEKNMAYIKIADYLEKIYKNNNPRFCGYGVKKVRILESLVAYFSYYTNFFAKILNNEVLNDIVKETYKKNKYEKEFCKKIFFILGKE